MVKIKKKFIVKYLCMCLKNDESVSNNKLASALKTSVSFAKFEKIKNFNFKSGIKDNLFKSFFYCLTDNTKCFLEFKKKAIKSANNEIDLLFIIPKLIQVESIIKVLETQNNDFLNLSSCRNYKKKKFKN